MRWTEQQFSELVDRSHTVLKKQRLNRARLGSTAPSEFAAQSAVVRHLELLAAPGVVFWHTPNGELRDVRAAKRLKAMGTVAGVPDLAILKAGRLHFLELKRERGGSLSRAQRAMHERLTAAGAVVETARGLDEALSVLRAWKVLRNGRRAS